MNTFRDAKADIADDALDGLILSRGNGRSGLRRVARTGHTRVVLRAALDGGKVAVISGGGAGHEPLHAGLVGPGLLSAAVSGGVFASPSADAVLTAIEHASGDAGCLLVVKNYTGDTLNFSLAAMRARERDIAVEEVVVRDDVCGAGGAKRARGIAGTALVHKVAAHFADSGASLEKVAAAARMAAKALLSVGVARNAGAVPGETQTRSIKDGCVEVGIGIHGEQGVETCELQGAQHVIDKLCDVLQKHVESGARYAAFFNNLGGLSVLESYVLFSAFTKTKLFSQIDYTMGPAALVTSLDMAGFSLTLIKLDPLYTDALLSPIDTPGWPGFVRVEPVQVPLPYVEPESAPPSSNPRMRNILEVVLDSCMAMRARLNELDAASGDGDTGSSVHAGAQQLQAALDQLPLNDPVQLLARIGEIAARAMGGSLGGIVGVLCVAASAALPRAGGDAQAWGDALDSGVRAVCDALNTERGHRSIVDALAPAADELRAGRSIKHAAAAARLGADSTCDMEARAGRAANVPAEAVQGTVDPGAEFAASVFEALENLV